MYNGLLNIYKEKDFTSHDVVAKLLRDLTSEKDWSYRNFGSKCRRSIAGLSWKRNKSYADMLTGTKKQYKVSFVFEKRDRHRRYMGNCYENNEPLKQDAPIKDTILSFVGEYDQGTTYVFCKEN